jgi:hypothetical protein
MGMKRAHGLVLHCKTLERVLLALKQVLRISYSPFARISLSQFAHLLFSHFALFYI